MIADTRRTRVARESTCNINMDMHIQNESAAATAFSPINMCAAVWGVRAHAVCVRGRAGEEEAQLCHASLVALGPTSGRAPAPEPSS